jgi:hypothetical protein
MPEPVIFDIEEVVKLDPADTTAFTPDHKTFLDEHKDELTTDELQRFGYETAPVKPTVRNTPVVKTGDEGGDGEGDDAAKEEQKKIDRQVSKAMEPILKQNVETQNKVELSTFIGGNPDFAKYRDSIAEHMKDPAYANIPVDRIAKMIAADDLMKIGARKEREAQRKAGDTINPGNSARASKTSKDWTTASKEEFEAERTRVLGHA